MRIGQVAPLFESVPPHKYGGTERVVSYLTEQLVALGHEVTLFASSDSVTTAELHARAGKSLRMNAGYDHALIPHLILFEEVRSRAREFDVIHFHNEYLHLPFLQGLEAPALTTLHGRLDQPHYEALFRPYSDFAFVSISHSQRTPLPWLNWKGPIYHGLPADRFPQEPREEGTYLAFLGRMSRDKRPDRAIEIARRAGLPLKIAAKLDALDQAYFDEEIAPLLAASPHVEFIGETNEQEKIEFLRGASALLFPIDWPEPFGLAMIESMACGTPVIAFRNGSTPEIVQNEVTGYLVDSIEEAVTRVRDAIDLDPAKCQAECRRRFSLEASVSAYLNVYEEIAAGDKTIIPWKTFSASTTRSI